MKDTVPDPEFDWKTSGLVNPLDCKYLKCFKSREYNPFDTPLVCKFNKCLQSALVKI